MLSFAKYLHAFCNSFVQAQPKKIFTKLWRYQHDLFFIDSWEIFGSIHHLRPSVNILTVAESAPQQCMFLIPISSETKLGVFELPFVSQSVSQSVGHTFVIQSHSVSAITLAVFNAGPPNLVQRCTCPSIISRSSSKMDYIDLISWPTKIGHQKCMFNYWPLSDIMCNGTPQGMHTDYGYKFRSRRENCSQGCDS